MSEFQWLTPGLQGFLLNASANLVGGLAATWTEHLLRSGGRRVRESLGAPPAQAALERAAAAAITATAADW